MTARLYAGLATEAFVEIGGETFYGIPNVDRLSPFLMSVLSDGDHWMYVSSRGGLTAGRNDANSGLFPYETDDRLHVAHGVTGPITVIRCHRAGTTSTWQPLHGPAVAGVQRNLYKSVVGNQVLFEEVNETLDMVFRYRWANSDRFGHVRTASLANLGGDSAEIELLDGLLNVLPHGLEPPMYRALSNLSNAYKRSEVADPDTLLAVYSLESLMSDRAEPAESLRATVVWSFGLDGAAVLLDGNAADTFREGAVVTPIPLTTGRPGAYLLESQQSLSPEEEVSWTIVADVAHDQGDVVELERFLHSTDPEEPVAESIRRGTETLVSLLASADGLQCTGDRMASVHHFANVAFNSMRGGLFVSATEIDRDRFTDFLRARNRQVAARHEATLAALPEMIDRSSLMDLVHSTEDEQLIRLALGYLPITFSRRHGDPSRPWNAFSIRVRDESGEPVVHYEGNWRDIFQNWEALSMSVPEYLPSMVSVFLSASTGDGFNPYRITSDGIDWEVPEPENPWSNIGYWGDHQIVYLTRLLTMTHRLQPAVLDSMLAQRWFAYANVPYRLAPYSALVADPHATIDYDEPAEERILARVAEIGQDGKQMAAPDGDVYLVTMIVKLLVPVLAKLSNLVPGGGIWMNTQRPEWNDANNALVGNGLSMVTAYYLRRHIDEIAALLERAGLDTVDISREVVAWMGALADVFEGNDGHIGEELSAVARRRIVDSLGDAFSKYRATIYSSGFSGSQPVAMSQVVVLLTSALRHLDDTIDRNRRNDGLFHSYNLVDFRDGDDVCLVEHLATMLEGQVAALSSGVLTAEQKVDLLEALSSSDLYRADQRSFVLYPPRRLPPFLEKNIIPEELVAESRLLQKLVASGDRRLIDVDGAGRYRFAPSCINKGALEDELDRIAADTQWRDLVGGERNLVLGAYESVFNHHAYTGRSGSMYGFEGIGSIYWHMVGKLLVAIQESVLEAHDASDATTARSLKDYYWRVRSGLGFEKTAAEYGAFPMDPYSHTPAHAGAQQPGMTGQVKEEILTRPLELGLRIKDGVIQIDPVLLRRGEFLEKPASWSVEAINGGRESIELSPGSLGMTICQVPLIVSLVDGSGAIEVVLADGTSRRFEGNSLDLETSAEIFGRTGLVRRVNASVPRAVADGG